MRDALEFEWMGKPSVVVVADALTGPADAMLRLSGVPQYPYVVVPFPVGNLTPAELAARADRLIGDVERLLCDRSPAQWHETGVGLGHRPGEGDTAADTEDSVRLTYDDAFAAIDDFSRLGWTDGLPIVPPTVERVTALLDAVEADPDEVIVRLDTRDGVDASVRDIAINAAMAGCTPITFPCVLAAMRAMADPVYNLHAHTATMAGAQQVLIVNGPARQALGLHSGESALGPGWPANNTIGRAVRLVIRNRLRSVPGEFDRAGFSHPGRFGWCFAEAEESSPWPQIAIQARALSSAPTQQQTGGSSGTVTVYATVWQASIINHDRDASALLDEIALVARTACHANWLHAAVATESSFFAARPFLFVTGREHARVLIGGGYGDIDALRHALFTRLTATHPTLRPVAIASPECVLLAYIHATGMQQSWFFAPFQSHNIAAATF